MARIFLSGASGNVGKALVREIAAGGEFELAGGWCPRSGRGFGDARGNRAARRRGGRLRSEEGVAASKPDIVVEFSAAAVMEDNLECYLRLGADAVIGTTGPEAGQACGARRARSSARAALVGAAELRARDKPRRQVPARGARVLPLRLGDGPPPRGDGQRAERYGGDAGGNFVRARGGNDSKQGDLRRRARRGHRRNAGFCREAFVSGAVFRGIR